MNTQSLIYTFQGSLPIRSKKKAMEHSAYIQSKLKSFRESTAILVKYSDDHYDATLHFTVDFNVNTDHLAEHNILSSVSLLFSFAQTLQLTLTNQHIYTEKL